MALLTRASVALISARNLIWPPNDQGHYGRTPEEAEAHAAAVSASDQRTEGNNMLSWHQMKAVIASVSAGDPNLTDLGCELRWSTGLRGKIQNVDGKTIRKKH